MQQPGASWKAVDHATMQKLSVSWRHQVVASDVCLDVTPPVLTLAPTPQPCPHPSQARSTTAGA